VTVISAITAKAAQPAAFDGAALIGHAGCFDPHQVSSVPAIQSRNAAKTAAKDPLYKPQSYQKTIS